MNSIDNNKQSEEKLIKMQEERIVNGTIFSISAKRLKKEEYQESCMILVYRDLKLM